jgi:hypothetical protein
VPRNIELEDDRLVWKFEAGTERRVAPKPQMLDDFVQLGDQPPAVILRYARRWGLLHLCKHGLPASHNPERGPLDPTWMGDEGNYSVAWCQELHLRTAPTGYAYFYEDVEAWRQYARRARAVLAIAAALHQGKCGQDEDWQMAVTPMWKATQKGARNLFSERLVLSTIVNMWVQYGDVTFKIDWWRQFQPNVLIGGHHRALTLFGALASQLLFAVCRSEGLTLCSNCGAPYTASRRPRTGRHYCDECRETGAPVRDATAAWRERKREKKRLALRRKG